LLSFCCCCCCCCCFCCFCCYGAFIAQDQHSATNMCHVPFHNHEYQFQKHQQSILAINESIIKKLFTRFSVHNSNKRTGCTRRSRTEQEENTNESIVEHPTTGQNSVQTKSKQTFCSLPFFTAQELLDYAHSHARVGNDKYLKMIEGKCCFGCSPKKFRFFILCFFGNKEYSELQLFYLRFLAFFSFPFLSFSAFFAFLPFPSHPFVNFLIANRKPLSFLSHQMRRALIPCHE
jgi:hypothetical protein